MYLHVRGEFIEVDIAVGLYDVLTVEVVDLFVGVD